MLLLADFRQFSLQAADCQVTAMISKNGKATVKSGRQRNRKDPETVYQMNESLLWETGGHVIKTDYPTTVKRTTFCRKVSVFRFCRSLVYRMRMAVSCVRNMINSNRSTVFGIYRGCTAGASAGQKDFHRGFWLWQILSDICHLLLFENFKRV